MFTDFTADLDEMDEMQALMNECAEQSDREEAEQSATLTLEQLADDIELGFGYEAEEELIDALRATALTNPISETAFDLQAEALALFI